MSSKTENTGLPATAAQTLSRRSLLDWLGKASVLALGSEVLVACGLPPAGPDADLGDADLGDADLGDGDLGDADLGDPWAFRPPEVEPEIYGGWPVRTVDQQELEQILATWRLEVGGMVDQSVSLTFPDLIALARQDQVVDFHCVEGWSVYDVPWNGVHLSTLFELVGASPEATHVSFYTVDERYNESLPIEVALEARTMLAYGVAGHTLPLRHGFPARLVVPRLFAYKSAKYIQRIELTDGPISGFWVEAGYPYLGEVPEDRLRPGRY